MLTREQLRDLDKRLRAGESIGTIADSLEISRTLIYKDVLRSGYEIKTDRCLVPVRPLGFAEEDPADMEPQEAFVA